jgi:hypothetical protein
VILYDLMNELRENKSIQRPKTILKSGGNYIVKRDHAILLGFGCGVDVVSI